MPPEPEPVASTHLTARFRSVVFMLVLSGLAGTSAAVAISIWINAEAPGPFLTFLTIRLSFIAFIVSLMGTYVPEEHWRSPRTNLPRNIWTIGWVLFVLHLVAAFHFYHDWSHQSAWEATQQQSGYGDGVYLNYVFGLLWTVDVFLWWWVPLYRKRHMKWWRYSLIGFMLFMMSNAAVVFASLPMQVLGGGMFAVLAVITWWGRKRA